jgi:uncharacterized surface protein with fasciclin (FAS1) repeats
MKIIPYINKMSRFSNGFFLLLICTVFLLHSCYNNDDVGGNYYTFKGELVGKYLQNRPYYFSEFNKMLDTAGVMGLLNTYGLYTVFAPDNKAMFDFYKSKGRYTLSQFPYDSIVIIAKNHILKDVRYESTEFPNGRIPYVSMSGRYLSSKLTVDSAGLPIILMNEKSKIIDNDTATNGIVYTVNKVFQPTDKRLPDVIKENLRFKLFSEAMSITNLEKLLLPIEDNTYVTDPSFVPYDGEWWGLKNVWRYTPLKRKYGFTALMESDSTFKANGINNIDDLKALAKQIYDQVYPEDAGITDITDRRNSLNRFVAYHLLDKNLGYRKFVYDFVNNGCPQLNKTNHIKAYYDMFEYLETMCPNTLMECRTNRVTNEWYGIFNMITETGKGIRINTNCKDQEAVNGVYHEIDGILAYTKEVVTELTSKRLRFDVSAFFPELINNNIRAPKLTQQWLIPDGYLANLTMRNTDGLWYLPAHDRLMDYQADEIFVVNKKYQTESYDITVTTYPIPSGTYEVRLGYLTNGGRGVAQFYLDGKACGIPLDMNPTSDNAEIGWKMPGSDQADPDGFENDKMMHNRGYMKGPASFNAVDDYGYKGASSRVNSQCIRRVFGIYTFPEDGKHTLRMKSVYPGQMELDWLEFVPVEYLDKEGID